MGGQRGERGDQHHHAEAGGDAGRLRRDGDGDDGKLKAADHPGRIIKELLKSRKLSLEFLAGRFSIDKEEFQKIMNEEAPLTKELAADLSRILGETPSHWLRMQAAFDLTKK